MVLPKYFHCQSGGHSSQVGWWGEGLGVCFGSKPFGGQY